MHPTQSQIFADHHNFLRLLRCLEAEIACYEADEAWSANLPVILDIFDYVQFYPEQYHHPLEDALFELLLAKQVGDAAQIRAMQVEHKTLEALTRKASQLFTSVANDSVVPVHELVRVTREFLDKQIAHINREHHLLCPLLAESVSDAEWDAIAATVARHKKDPLFDKAIIDEYENLYHAILQAESSVVIGATARPIQRPAATL
jgi:hemerythrin-like domain-containing protein